MTGAEVSVRAKTAAAEVLRIARDRRYPAALAEWMIATRIQQEIDAERRACSDVAVEHGSASPFSARLAALRIGRLIRARWSA